jgi:hypothetical protein
MATIDTVRIVAGYPRYNTYFVGIFRKSGNKKGRRYFTTDGRSVSMAWYRAPLWHCDQILLPVAKLLSEICGLVSVGLPL